MRSFGSAALLAATVFFGLHAAADEPAKSADVAQQSLPLRTALHHDPLLDAPLERLLALYRGANKQEELISMYRQHVAQFPDDPNGATVLIRLLTANGDAEAERLAANAMTRFTKNPGVYYIAAQIARKRQDPKAVDYLDKAIELQSEPARKAAWIGQLLDLAALQERRELISKHLLAQVPLAATADARVDLARRMNKYKLYEPVLELAKKSDASTAAEAMVSLELEAATAEVGLERPAAAAARLDRLLRRLSADYWQRADIMRRRLALVATQTERDAMVRQARQRVADRPQDETAALDLAQVLSGLDQRRAAMDVLMEASKRLPQSEAIEKRCLELLDDFRDDHAREAFLAARIEQMPGRGDLVLAHVKALYAVNRAKEAAAELDAALAKLPPADQDAQLLQVARMLRRASMPAEAAELFDRVVRRSPARFDLRREMAETCLAAGDRRKVRELFADLDPAKVELENLLDLAPFMIQQQFYPEAKTLLTKRLAAEKNSLELRLLLVDVERRLGSAEAGAARLLEARALADTSARYRQWLEAAVSFHKEFDTLDAFLKAELTRLDAEPAAWTDGRLERRLAFAEAAGRGEQRSMIASLLQRDLASAPPKAMALRLRRQLLAMMEETPGGGGDMADQIQRLAADDPQLRQEAAARLVLWHLKQQRYDLANQALQRLDVSKVSDPALLAALRLAYEQVGATLPQTLALLERLTEVSPTDRAAWERWISGLAVEHDEVRLAAVIRRLLAGVQDPRAGTPPLSPATCDALRGQLFDAQSRQALKCIAAGTDASLADALPVLSQAERSAREDAQWVWITWLRALVLNRLDRQQARDEAIAEMERVVRKMQPAAKSESLRIGFPDGLTMSLARARQMLTAPRTPPEVPPALRREGPLPPLVLRWSFDTRQSPVVLILPLAGDRVIIGDRKGTLFCLDKRSGKLLWQEDGALRAAATPVYGYGADVYGNSQPQSPAPPVVLADELDHLFTADGDAVTCRAGEDGRVLWKSEIGQTTAAGARRIDAVLFLDHGILVAADPPSGTVAKIDPSTGKVLWERVIPADKQQTAPLASGGASLSGRRLLVYGPRTGIVDLDTGDLEWSFESWRVKTFPVKLAETDTPPEDPNVGALVSAAPAPSGPVYAPYTTPYPAAPVYYSRAGRIYAMPPRYYPSSPYVPAAAPQQAIAIDGSDPSQAGGIPQVEFSLAGPAVVWATQVRQNPGCFGAINGSMLLLGDPTGIRSIRLDLPFLGQRFNAAGELACLSGRYAYLFNGGNFQALDLIHHRIATITPHAPSLECKQWVVDGPVLYLTTCTGILCLRMPGGQTVFTSRWPAAADVKRPAAAAGVLLSTPAYGAAPYGAAPPVAVPDVAPSNVARVSQGVLYTLAAPTRVVALGGADDHGK